MKKETRPFLFIFLLFTVGMILTNISDSRTLDKKNMLSEIAPDFEKKGVTFLSESVLANTANCFNRSHENNTDTCYQYSAFENRAKHKSQNLLASIETPIPVYQTLKY